MDPPATRVRLERDAQQLPVGPEVVDHAIEVAAVGAEHAPEAPIPVEDGPCRPEPGGREQRRAHAPLGGPGDVVLDPGELVLVPAELRLVGEGGERPGQAERAQHLLVAQAEESGRSGRRPEGLGNAAPVNLDAAFPARLDPGQDTGPNLVARDYSRHQLGAGPAAHLSEGECGRDHGRSRVSRGAGVVVV